MTSHPNGPWVWLLTGAPTNETPSGPGGQWLSVWADGPGQRGIWIQGHVEAWFLLLLVRNREFLFFPFFLKVFYFACLFPKNVCWLFLPRLLSFFPLHVNPHPQWGAGSGRPAVPQAGALGLASSTFIALHSVTSSPSLWENCFPFGMEIPPSDWSEERSFNALFAQLPQKSVSMCLPSAWACWSDGHTLSMTLGRWRCLTVDSGRVPYTGALGGKVTPSALFSQMFSWSPGEGSVRADLSLTSLTFLSTVLFSYYSMKGAASDQSPPHVCPPSWHFQFQFYGYLWLIKLLFKIIKLFYNYENSITISYNFLNIGKIEEIESPIIPPTVIFDTFLSFKYKNWHHILFILLFFPLLR